ncbi:hypothetical protein CPB84DRAFT_1838769 [Gymnopilus junonius]|uniref:N-acetyltransferase domain-containing protein n=1 Tax=Gymnopilus junonius TaxID=109634 RepID=A0A9P5NA35_GYMJU|nr:hypothetical protein CPB84DRAFT_1838769 [Gymnopilus junonius]
MSTTNAAHAPEDPEEPHIRLSTPADFDELADVALRAFIEDPVMNYFGSVKKMLEIDVDVKASAARRQFYVFLLKACFFIGGRITILVDRPAGSTKERLLAGALWLPPHKRLAAWMIPTMVKSGVISVLKGWGLTGFVRIVFHYQESVEHTMHKIFESKGAKTSPDNSWYLQLAFTDPPHHGKGFMSLLVREAFAHSPKDTYTLEATTAKSRDQYAHLGFENATTIPLGKGKVDNRGVSVSGNMATGIECWAMVKVCSHFGCMPR